MSLNEIFCQDKAIGTLQRAYGAGKMAHAYIFAGPDGVGKFTTAKAWAKVLLCRNKKEEKSDTGIFYDSCDECDSCILFESDGHPDFKLVYKELREFTKDGKGKSTPVDLPIQVIREFLIDKAATKPVMGNWTIFAVRQAEKLNRSSQNALLKVLEEPPKHCCIFLLCSKPENLLPTTLSRCQVVRFGEVDEKYVIEKLLETGVDKTQARYWARFGGGSVGAAIEWSSLNNEDLNCYDIKTELVDRLCTIELTDAIDFAEWLGKMSGKIADQWFKQAENISKTDIVRRVQKGLLQMIAGALNDAVKMNTGSESDITNFDQAEKIRKIALKYDLSEMADKIAKTYENMRWVDASVNEKLIFEELLLNLTGGGIIGSS